jgi:cytochrome c oxidase subunit IV
MNMEESMKQGRPQVHIVPYKTNILVCIALLILLAMTIAVARFHFTKYSVMINLFIASLKAGLVLMFFMHLKYEGKFLKRLLLLAISTLTFVIALTFSDVWYR